MSATIRKIRIFIATPVAPWLITKLYLSVYMVALLRSYASPQHDPKYATGCKVSFDEQKAGEGLADQESFL